MAEQVTQADREAAAAYVSIAFGKQYASSVLNEGRWPDLVQAFARHRAKARADALEEAARVADAYARGPFAQKTHGQNVAAAIRNLKEAGDA